MIIPPEWTEIIKRVRTHDFNAVIGGGALRDTFCQRPIKDLDIVVNAHTSVKDVAALFGFEGPIDVTSIESAEQDANFSFSGKFTIKGFNLPVEIIGARKRETPIDKCIMNDFGLCQIWYDGEFMNHTTLYEFDVYHQCMTLDRCNSMDEWKAIQKHYKRLQKKYDWPMRIPSHHMLNLISGFNFDGSMDLTSPVTIP